MTTGASTNNNAMDWSADNAPKKYVYEDKVDIAVHDTAKMDSPLAYYNDNGDITKLPAKLNESIDNPISFRADKLEDADLGIYPRKDESDNSASAKDASEWTSGSHLSVNQSDGSTAESVRSIKIHTDGTLGSSNKTSATYANQSITTDPGKRVFFAIVNVNSLESGTNITYAVEDGDGDRKELYVNASKSASADSVIANTTGSGFVVQQKLHTLATKGNGDGTFEGIQKIVVTVEGGDASTTVTGIDVQRKSKVVIGERKADTDDDDSLETVTVKEITSSGAASYRSLSSMGDVFSKAKVHDLTVKGLKYRVRDLPSGDVDVNFDTGAAEPYSYPNDFEQFGRLKVPAAIDLTHHGLKLVAVQKFVEDRYTKFRYVEGAGDTAFSDISSWSDASSKLKDVGDKIVIDDTVQAGTYYDVHQVVLLQKGQADNLKFSTSGKTGGGGGQSSGGANMGFIAGIFAALLAAIKKFDL